MIMLFGHIRSGGRSSKAIHFVGIVFFWWHANEVINKTINYQNTYLLNKYLQFSTRYLSYHCNFDAIFNSVDIFLYTPYNILI